MQAAARTAPALWAGTIGLAARRRGGRAERFSIDARLSLTISFLYGKEKKYAIRFGRRAGIRFLRQKKFKKNPDIEKSGCKLLAVATT
jgi:hypothetical protein